MRKVLVPVLLSIAVNFGACNFAKIVADNAPPMMDDQTLAFYRESSLKQAREAAPALLKLLDGFIISSPDNEDLMIRGAALYCGFALTLVEDEDPEYASSLYRHGYDYAIRILAHKIEGLPALLDGPVDKLSEALAGLDPDDVAPVFWAGGCLGGWMNLNLEDVEAMAEIPKVLAFIRRAAQMDDTYYYGGPHLFLGIFNGTMGKAFGGDPEASRAHFERLFKITKGKFLLGKVYFAKTYAVQTQNRALFESTLNEVLEAPQGDAPDLVMPNNAAKRKAEKLLEDVDDYFLDD
ncbi:MAG: hypothetical protein GXP54_13515 [Deltaproteobacteria bacterium]|nr:hypothetical protein [Deltaproteobacteria bacterium]